MKMKNYFWMLLVPTLLFPSALVYCQQSNIRVNNQWIAQIFADTMSTFAPNSDINEECRRQGSMYKEQLENNTLWAIRMLDSSVVHPLGLIDGQTYQLGHADQCTHTKIPIKNFATQFCLPSANFAPHNRENFPDFFNIEADDWASYNGSENIWDYLRPRDDFIRHKRTQFNWGICIPEVCTAEDIHTSLQKALGEAFSKHGIDFQVELNPIQCYSTSEVASRKMTFLGKIFLLCVVTLVFLMFIGSIVDYNIRKRKKICEEELKLGFINSFFITFSFITNMERLSNKNEENEIPVTHGLKFIAVSISIMFHREVLLLAYSQNLSFLEMMFHNPNYNLFTTSVHMLDTFFFLAGFLLAWNLIKNDGSKSARTLSFIQVIVYRVIRLHPFYLFLMGFTIWILPYIAEGPLWKIYAETESQNCKIYWWQNILMIANLLPNTEFCMPIVWSLNAEFQLFLIGLFLVNFLNTSCTKHRTVILVITFIISQIVPSLFLYYFNETSVIYMSVKLFRDPFHQPHMMRIYTQLYTRCAPYIFGFCTAYVIKDLMKRNFKFTGAQKLIIFIIATAAQFAVFYVGALFLVPRHPYNVWEHVVFSIIHRFTWSSALASILIIHQCGNFGAVSDFLSHPFFIPLGRLSYHMYLINFMVISVDVFQSQGSSYGSLYIWFLRSMGDITLTAIIALFTTVLIDSPISALRKSFMKTEMSQKKNS